MVEAKPNKAQQKDEETFCWYFFEPKNFAWRAYDDAQVLQIEGTFRQFLKVPDLQKTTAAAPKAVLNMAHAQYQLDFATMEQQNTKTGTKKPIMRAHNADLIAKIGAWEYLPPDSGTWVHYSRQDNARVEGLFKKCSLSAQEVARQEHYDHAVDYNFKAMTLTQQKKGGASYKFQLRRTLQDGVNAYYNTVNFSWSALSPKKNDYKAYPQDLCNVLEIKYRTYAFSGALKLSQKVQFALGNKTIEVDFESMISRCVQSGGQRIMRRLELPRPSNGMKYFSAPQHVAETPRLAQPKVQWMYRNRDNTLSPYDKATNEAIENSFIQFQATIAQNSFQFTLQPKNISYVVDFEKMVQTNLQTNFVRSVVRRIEGWQ